MVGYDEETNQVSFDVPFGAAAQPASISGRAPGAMLLAPPYQKVETRYRIRLHFFSNWVTLVSDQSDFEIQYYPISGRSYSLQKDDEWKSASGLATDPRAPDFAEDLDHALNQGYQELLKIRSYTGLLFRPLSTPQGILVTDIGAAEGQTSLTWGTLKISARRINNGPQMQQVATHELVHLLSDQHYNSVSAARNRWFFEATAEYFAARARGLSEGARGRHYANPSINNDVYLSIPINSANVSSYYPAAHFLDWCSRQYGETVVPEAIVYGSGHPLDRNDVTHFSKSLELHGEPGGIGAAYAAYIRGLISKPEDYGGANSDFKFNITTYTAQHNLSATEFDEFVTYIKLSRLLRPMSTAGVFLWGRNSDDALLVIDSASSSGGSPQAVTYDFYSTLNSAYANATPLDQGLAFPYPNKGIITVPHFGHMEAKKQLEQLIANASIAGDAQIEVIYYLLRPPPVTEVADGVVRWSIGKLGNMPRELIQGYHVYKNGSQLTGAPVPVPAEGWDNLSFQSEQIQQGDTIVVQVVDRKGNAWPRVQVVVPPTPTPTPTLTPTPTSTTTPEIPVTRAAGDSFWQVGDTVSLVIYGVPMLKSCSGDCQWAPYRSTSFYAGFAELTVARVQGQSIYLNHQDDFCRVEVWIDFDPTGGIDRLHAERYCGRVTLNQATPDLENPKGPWTDMEGYSDESYTFSGLALDRQVTGEQKFLTFELEEGKAVGHATGSYHHHCTSTIVSEEGMVAPICPCITEAGPDPSYGEVEGGLDRTTCDQLFRWEATSETFTQVSITIVSAKLG
ncbi:MAG: hypothetical protein KJ734_13065 [Chloroflexi bacterium]|nr:hypothetical protein [Chloroflexota bacterium]